MSITFYDIMKNFEQNYRELLGRYHQQKGLFAAFAIRINTGIISPKLQVFLSVFCVVRR